ncbi:large-conductance mechanosensitive channel [Clostridium botulinum H04402 065]|nr:large-conductance mechanosensitive channel [Clostridium botulinum H04402 065]
MFIKLINKFNKKEEEVKEEPKISNEEILLTEIRDLLKESKS